VINENAGQLFADSLVDKGCDDTGVNAAGKSQNDGLVAYLSPDIGDSFFDKVFHSPLAGAAALVKAEFDQGFNGGSGSEFHAIHTGEHFSGTVHGDLGQIESGDPGGLGGEFGFIFIGTENDTDRFLCLEPFQRNRTRHNHCVNFCTAHGACDLLNLIAIAIDQNNCFRSNFHSNLTSSVSYLKQSIRASARSFKNLQYSTLKMI